MRVTGSTGFEYILEDRPFKGGGEGEIYRIIGNHSKLVKLYHRDRITSTLEAKLLLMMKNPPNKSILAQVAWPLDIVYDSQKNFCGFVMPCLDINATLRDVYVYPPDENRKITFQQKLIIAQNICVVIDGVHRAGYVFGDFNPQNIGVNLKTGSVAFMDTDSYHIVIDKSTNRAFRCEVCAPGYVAPELLKKCISHTNLHPEDKQAAYARTPLDTFTMETDNFALAIHMFRLLMNGFHPFGGIKQLESASVASPGVGDQAILRDSYCFKPGNKHLSAAVPPLSVHPKEIGTLFARAFIDGKLDSKRRPNAAEWYRAMQIYERELAQCGYDHNHQYWSSLSICPWCEAEDRFADRMGLPRKMRVKPQPSVKPQKHRFIKWFLSLLFIGALGVATYTLLVENNIISPIDTVSSTSSSPSQYTFNFTTDSLNEFDDIKADSWYYEAVQFVVGNGILSGTSKNIFSPEETATRGMFVTALARLDNQETSGGNTYYEKSMKWAKANGICDGENPEQPITREQLATMLYRYAGSPSCDGDLNNFSDSQEISKFAIEGLQWAVNEKIINGEGNSRLNPKGTASRAEIATVIYRYCERAYKE